MTTPVAVGLVGVSGFARIHYAEVLRAVAAGTVRLAAAAIINQDEEAEKCAELRRLGCRIHSDLDAMLVAEAADLDLVVVPTGIHLHEPMTVAALKAGCDVLVEKPAAADSAAVDRMLAVERDCGRRVAVAFQHHYAPTTIAVERALLTGAIGVVRTIAVLGLWPRRDDYFARNRWAGRRTVDGMIVNDAPFHNAFAHYVNLACRFAGNLDQHNGHPERVTAHLWRARPIPSCDSASFTVDFTGGVTAHIHLTHCSRQNLSPRILLQGETGRIEWATYGAPELIRPDGSRETIGDPAAKEERAVWDHVPRWVRGDPTARWCSLAMAREQVLCSDLVFTAPIRDVPADRIDPVGEGLERVPVIRGIDEIFEAAWSEGRALTPAESAIIG